MRSILFVLALLAVSVAQAQSYVCPSCGKVHQGNAPAVQQYAPATGNDGLSLLNRQRAARGLGPLRQDPALMQGALSKATTAARRGVKGHLGGSMFGASKEGVGYSSGRRVFMACYAYSAPAGTAAGAAIVQGRGGAWYSCLLIRHQGYLPSGSTNGPVRRRILRR